MPIPSGGGGQGGGGVEYGRRPYVEKSTPSYQAGQRRVTLSHAQKNPHPHSELEKPYISDDYPEMQHWEPPSANVSWPTMPGIDPNGYPAIGDNPEEEDKLGWYITGCSLDCPSLVRGGDCGGEVCCTINPQWQLIDKVRVSGPAVLTQYRDGIVCFRVDANATTPIRIHVMMKPKAGQLKATGCDGMVSTDCLDCDCALADALALDTESTAETIARSSNIGIYLTGGCPPYRWTVSGTGFTISAKTTEPRNFLYADATACGMANVEVSDYCGGSLSIPIRCDEGEWVRLDGGDGADVMLYADVQLAGCRPAGCVMCNYNCEPGNISLIIGDMMYWAYGGVMQNCWGQEEGVGVPSCNTSGYKWVHTDCSETVYTFPFTPSSGEVCGDSDEGAYCTEGGGVCIRSNARVAQWRC